MLDCTVSSISQKEDFAENKVISSNVLYIDSQSLVKPARNTISQCKYKMKKNSPMLDTFE